MSYKEILKKDTEVNKIGNFVSFSVGAGNTVLKATGNYLWAGSGNPSSAPFKVNRQTGVLSATGASISGTITATGGSITGDMSVTGSITAGGSTSVVLQGSNGRLLFKRSGTERGAIYVDSSNRLQFSANGSDGMYFDSNSRLYVKNDIYVTNGSISILNDFTSTKGSAYFYNNIQSGNGSIYAETGDVYAKEASVWCKYDMYSTNGSIRAYDNIYTDHGSIRAYNDIYSTNGRLKAKDKFVCDDKEGVDISGDEIVTSVFWDDDNDKLKIRTRVYKCRGGIIYSRGSESERTVHDFS